MSAAQRLDEVFGLPEGSEVYVLNDFKSSAYDAVRLFETWASTSFAISRFTPVRRMKVLRARLSRLANTTINVTICRGALKRRISTMKVEMIYLSQEDVIRCGGMSMDKAIDDWETDKHRMGDTMAYMFRDGKIDDSRIDASVSDLVAGRKSGRDNDDQLTYTCNVGLGLYDVAIAARVYQYAKENGIGQKLKLWDEPIMV